LPILVDPSHGTGIRDLVIPIVARRGGLWRRRLLVEVHEKSRRGPSDGAQSLYPEGFRNLMGALAPVVQAVGASWHERARIGEAQALALCRQLPARSTRSISMRH